MDEGNVRFVKRRMVISSKRGLKNIQLVGDIVENAWGLLGPEFLPDLRRTRTLGLGATVRLFNDLAVPGLGGVWFGKQLLLAMLGVKVAEEARAQGVKVQNIEVANAIEALACWLSFRENKWTKDSRLRGRTKLNDKDKDEDFSFSRARQRNFYVTQPMRMATVQALPALGLVDTDGTRFNAFRCSDAGTAFVEKACCDFRPHNKTVINHLLQWVLEKKDIRHTPPLQGALSPLLGLPQESRVILRERLIQGGKESSEDKRRRNSAYAWVERIRQNQEGNNWDIKPDCINVQHWNDLLAGKKLFKTRDAAFAVLDALETHIGNQSMAQSYSLDEEMQETLQPLIEALKKTAHAFLETKHDETNANVFCRECVQQDAKAILRSLVNRDGHVLRLVDNVVKPGPAFRGTVLTHIEEDQDREETPNAIISLPEGISYRMRNLYLLNLDLHGELEQHLNPTVDGVLQ